MKSPDWLKCGSPIYVKNFQKTRKDDPKVVPARLVKLLSPQHAKVAFPDTKKVETIWTKYIAKRAEESKAVKESEDQVEYIQFDCETISAEPVGHDIKKQVGCTTFSQLPLNDSTSDSKNQSIDKPVEAIGPVLRRSQHQK